MGFGDCASTDGQQLLNDYLASNSYIDGASQTQGDRVVYDALQQAGFVSSPVIRMDRKGENVLATEKERVNTWHFMTL